MKNIFLPFYLLILLYPTQDLLGQETAQFDTIYRTKNGDISTSKKEKIYQVISKNTIELSDGNLVYPYTVYKKNIAGYVTGYSSDHDSLSDDYILSFYRNENRIAKVLIFDYLKYIDTLEIYKYYYDLLSPYLSNTFVPLDSSFTLQISFRRNGKLDFVAVYEPDGCIGSSFSTNRFNENIFYIRDRSDMGRHGRDFIYSSDGQIVKEAYYKNDLRHGPWKEYNSEGQLKKLTSYKEDIQNGLETKYNKDGKMVYSKNYLDRKYHGEQKKYDKNGILRELKYFDKGFEHGEWKYYDKDGILIYKKYYLKGKLIRTETF